MRQVKQPTIPATHYIQNIFHILIVYGFHERLETLTVISGNCYKQIDKLTLKNLNENNLI